MKVLINGKKKLPVSQIPCGSCFIAPRSASREEALYIKVDKDSGAVLKAPPQFISNSVLALNLQTGQLRWFNKDENVQPYDAEVN